MPKSYAKNTEQEVTSLRDFLSNISEMRKQWELDKRPIGPWYRGQQRKRWSLVPNIVRIGAHDRDTEDQIREKFVVRAPALNLAGPLPDDD
jgi:hypothetical protein